MTITLSDIEAGEVRGSFVEPGAMRSEMKWEGLPQESLGSSIKECVIPSVMSAMMGDDGLSEVVETVDVWQTGVETVDRV